MENTVKGTRYDAGNSCRHRRYCGNNYQHNCYRYQYPANLQETIDIKKATAHFLPRCVVAFW